MIKEIETKAVAPSPRQTASTLTLGSESIFAPASEFVVEITQPEARATRVRQAEVPGVGEPAFLLWTEIADATWQRAQRLAGSAAAWTQAGFAFLAGRNFTAARNAFTSALEIEPKARNARLGLARTSFEDGKSDEARRILLELIEDSPDDIQARVSLAMVLAGEGQADEALKQLQGEVPESHSFALYLAARGGIKFVLGDLRGTVSDLRKVVRLRSDWVHVRNVLGLAELGMGHERAAERQFRAATRIGPMSLEPLQNLVRLLVARSRWDEVLTAVERHWNPSTVPAELGRYAADACLELGDARSARNWLDGLHERSRDAKERAEILNNLGVAYTRLNRLDDAGKAFLRSTNEMPTEIAITNYARTVLEIGNPAGVLEWLAKWRSVPLGGLGAPKVAAIALMHLGRNEDAVALATRITERPDADEEAFALLSAVYADGVQDSLAAVVSAQAGVQRWPGSTLLANNLAYALLLAGKPEEAARCLEAIDESTVDPERRVYLTATRGLLALWRGDLAIGQRLYEEAARLAGRESLRTKVKVKRDLEVARAMRRLGSADAEVVRLLRRASEGGRSAEPYASQARRELSLLTGGPGESEDQATE